MRGGLINKAQRGALAVTLPIGFRRTAKGGVMLDPDEAVRLAIATVFERFGVLRNARAVQRHFLTNGLKLPRLIQSGPEAGQIVWVRPSCTLGRRLVATGCKLARRASSLGATSVHPCHEHHDGTCAPTSWP